MNVYLAGISSRPDVCTMIDDLVASGHRRPFILESFAYYKAHLDHHVAKNWRFMADSGAFTFLGQARKKKGSDGKIDWDAYVEQYADFLVRCDVELFFELDLYTLIGISETNRLRAKLNKLTGREAIPVWHYPVGVPMYEEFCKRWKYVAIGASGRIDSKWTRTQPAALRGFIAMAHRQRVKIHGLGYTIMKKLPEMPFDSVDSSTWTMSRMGEVQYFNGKQIIRTYPTGEKATAANNGRKKIFFSEKASLHNVREWIKFQEYAERWL